MQMKLLLFINDVGIMTIGNFIRITTIFVPLVVPRD